MSGSFDVVTGHKSDVPGSGFASEFQMACLTQAISHPKIAKAGLDRPCHSGITSDLPGQRVREAFELASFEIVLILITRVVLQVQLARTPPWVRIFDVDMESIVLH